MWQPIKNWYTPPTMHPGVKKYDILIPLDLDDKMGMLIGSHGKNFKRITEETGCYYIFYLSVPNKVEIWGPVESIRPAVRKIWDLIHKTRDTRTTRVTTTISL
jgi:hypothetical protein